MHIRIYLLIILYAHTLSLCKLLHERKLNPFRHLGVTEIGKNSSTDIYLKLEPCQG